VISVPNVSFIAAASSGAGRYIPDKPTISYSGTGSFSITNYDPNLIYNITVNTGTFTRNGASISLNNTSMEATISASPPKGGISSSSTIIGRAPLTNQNVQVQSTCASGDDNLPGFWILMPHSCTVTVSQVAPPPTNYVNAGAEYRRIT
jgi:hypothetical protein